MTGPPAGTSRQAADEEGRRNAPIQTSRRRISLSAGINLAARIAGAALGVLVAAILARSLGPDQFGSFALVLAMATMAGNISEFGFGQVAVRQMAAVPERRPEVLAAYLAARVGLSLVLAVVVAVASWALLPGEALAMGLLIALSIPVGAAGAVQVGAQARFRLDLIGATTLVQSVAWLVAVAVLARTDASLTWYGVTFLAVSIGQTTVAWLLTSRVTTVARRVDTLLIGDLARLAVPLGIAGLFVTAYYRLDSVILYAFRGADETAFFAAAYRFLDVLQVFPGVVAAVILPYIALKRSSTSKPAIAASRLALTLLGALALPIVAGGIVFADEIVFALYGPNFRPAAQLLAILLPAFISISAGYVFTSVLVAQGRTMRLAVVAACGALMSITANLMLVPQYGATAAAIITVLTEFSVMTVVAVMAYGPLLRDVVPWSRLLRSCVATGLMVVAALSVSGLPLAPAMIVCAAVYVPAAAALGAVRRADVTALLSRHLAVET